jgi:hypothetical protein
MCCILHPVYGTSRGFSLTPDEEPPATVQAFEVLTQLPDDYDNDITPFQPYGENGAENIPRVSTLVPR